MTTTVLTQISAGCPNNLGNTAGDLYNILKWALPQFGWTLEFDDAVNFKAAFSNNPANPAHGGFLRILDDGSSGAGASRAAVRGYASMTDVDTGTGAMTAAGIQKDYDGGGSGEFEIWGNENYFCLMNETDHISGSVIPRMISFFGNIVARDPSDNMFVTLTSSQALSTATAANSPWYDQATPLACRPATTRVDSRRALTSYDGLTPNVTIAAFVSAYFIPNFTATESLIGSDASLSVFPADPITGDFHVDLGYICDEETLRGRLPGILFPIGNWIDDPTYTDGDILSITNSLGTHEYEVIYVSDSNRATNDLACLLIERDRNDV